MADLFTDLSFLEAKTEAGMVFVLATDFVAALHVLPANYPRYQTLRLLGSALRRDADFIARHPTALFQCLWNSCWWYDCSEAARHYDPPGGGWPPEDPPWERPEPRLSTLLEAWRAAKEQRIPGFVWVRSLRPPVERLNVTKGVVLRGHRGRVNRLAFSKDGQSVTGIWSAGRPGTPLGWLGEDGIQVWDAASGAKLLDVCPPELREFVTGAQSRTFSWERTVSPSNMSGIWQICSRAGSGSPDRFVYLSRRRPWTFVCDAETGTPLARLRGMYVDSVTPVAVSPDGTRAVIPGSAILPPGHDGTVWVWDVLDGTRRAHLRCPERAHVAFSPDGERFACSEGDMIRVYDMTKAESVYRKKFGGHANRCLRLLWHLLPWLIAFAIALPPGWFEGLWAAVALRLEGGQPNGFSGLEWLMWIITAIVLQWLLNRLDRFTGIWDTTSEAAIAMLRGQGVKVDWLTFSPDGLLLASSGTDPSGTQGLYIWDATAGTPIASHRGHKAIAGGFSPDGSCVCSQSGDGTVCVWDVSGQSRLACIPDQGEGILCATFSPDGHRLACGSKDGTVGIWDTNDGHEHTKFQGHTGAVHFVAFSPDGSRLAYGVDDGSIVIWSGDVRAAGATLRNEAAQHRLIAIAPDGQHVVSLEFDDCGDAPTRSGSRHKPQPASHLELVNRAGQLVVRVWNPLTGLQLSEFKRGQATLDNLPRLTFSSDGRRIVLHHKWWDTDHEFWSVPGGTRLSPLLADISFSQVSPDGQRVIGWAIGGAYFVFDLSGECPPISLTAPGAEGGSHRFSPDGKMIITERKDGTSCIRDASTGEFVALFATPKIPEGVASRARSPDGRRMALEKGKVDSWFLEPHWDNTLWVWDLLQGTKVECQFNDYRGQKVWPTFSPDGNLLAAVVDVRAGAWLRVWDANTGKQLGCFLKDESTIDGPHVQIASVMFSTDGRRVFIREEDSTVRGWDLASGKSVIVAKGCLDLSEVAAGAERFPWLAFVGPFETAIVSAEDHRPVAWLPETFEILKALPTGRTWVGARGPHLSVLALEGEPERVG